MAGRIPQPFIDDLIDRTDIVELVRSRTSLKKSGKNYSACCPFHDEKTPSFTVSPQKQFYYCFGCGAGGNAIGFLMEHDHLDFPTAVEVLAKTAGMEIPREESNPRAEAIRKRRVDIYDQLQRAAELYQLKLRKHQPAVDYLKRRGLTGEIAREFGLGYVPDAWDSVLNLCGEDDSALKLMIDGGMLIKREHADGYYDRFRDRIMFPIRDTRGRVIGFGGRVLGDQKPKYLNSPETTVFHKGRELYGLFESQQRKQKPTELIVVEGYMDVVALAQYNIRNAVATLGTSVGAAHMERIFRHVSQVVFCFDGDNAGRSAARRALDACLPAMIDGRQARFLFLPEGEDPDSVVRAEGIEGFGDRVANAVPLSDFVFELAASDLKLDSADHRALFAHRALPFLRQLPKGLLSAALMNRLAEESRIAEQDLQQLESKPAPEPQFQIEQPAPQGEMESDEIFPEGYEAGYRQSGEYWPEEAKSNRPIYSKPFKRLLELVLQYPRLVLDESLKNKHIVEADVEQLLPHIREQVEQDSDAEFVKLHGFWTGYQPEVAERLTHIYGSTLLNTLPSEQIELEFGEILTRFIHRRDQNTVKERLKAISAIPFEELTAELRTELKALHTSLKG